MVKTCLCAVAGAFLAIWASVSAAAQGWPARPLTLVVPFPAGGATDAIGRVLAERLGKGLGQQVVVDNRTGAGGAIGAAFTAKAAPDGYTVLMATTSTHVVLPLTQRQLAYDPLKDFKPVGMVATAPNLLIASPTLPVSSAADLIRHAKENPGKLNFASSGHGTITHLIAEMFRLQAGIDVTHVPYRGGVQAVTDLTSGQIAFVIDSIVWSLPLVQAGKLKGLGVTSTTRSTLAPDQPTIAEAALPGFEGITWFGLVVPAGTSDPIVQRLQAELAAALKDKELAERFAGFGAEPTAGTAEAFLATMGRDMAKWGDVIERAGVKVQ